jgi:hypothetical protein
MIEPARPDEPDPQAVQDAVDRAVAAEVARDPRILTPAKAEAPPWVASTSRPSSPAAALETGDEE